MKRTPRRHDPAAIAMKMVENHYTIDEGSALDVIERSGDQMTQLEDAINPTVGKTIKRLERELKRLLPPEKRTAFLRLSDAYLEEGTARMQAGFLLGMAVSRRIFDITFGVDNAPTGKRKGGVR